MRQATKTRLFLIFLALVAGGSSILAYRHFRAPVATAATESTRVSGGIVDGGIPSIYDPTFTRTVVADQYLKNEGLGLDVELGGKHRFYPYQILVWHEVVNDAFDGKPLVVTFCPLSYLGAVYERSAGGQVYTFGVSNMLENSNTLLEDEQTHSLWKQATGSAVQGDEIGKTLVAFPSHVMRWADWKTAYPDGQVLSLKTGFERDYTRDPYAAYYPTDAIWFPLSVEDTRLRLKDYVYGVVVDGKTKAYPAEIVEGQATIDDTVAGASVRIVYDKDLGEVRAYRRNGTDLGDELPITYAFWFAWSNAHPETELYLP